MTVSFQLPPDIEKLLRQGSADIDREAREVFLVDLYRRGRLSHVALAGALGLDRFQTEEVLQQHRVTEDLGTVEDYLADARTLEQLRTPEDR